MAGEVVRERLLSVLRGRHDRRLTLVVAGAGFGKTTLLRQMTTDAAVNPLGIDAVVRCGPDDDDLSVFAGRIRVSLGLDPLALADVEAEAKAITRSLTASSPTNACLVVDDLHKLTPGSPSMALLAAILDRLPATGHLALFSRVRPDLPFARELANGTALMLTDADLSFTKDEWAVAVGARGSETFTPWPALAALVASSTDPSVSADYVWQEVLQTLRPDQRRLLALAATIGGGDATMLRAVAGPESDPADLTDVPLVRVDRSGWWPHDLWADHLDDAFAEVLSPTERATAQATAASEYLKRADYVAAFRLARAAGDEAMWRSVVNKAFGVLPPSVGRDVMLRWAADLATAAPGSAEQLYLDGKRAADERDSARALERFLRARALAEAAGDHHAERNVIVDLALVGLAVDRIDVVASLLPRAVALADEGLPEGITMQTMGKAMIDEISGNIEAAIAHHRSVVEPPGTWLANMAHYNAGRMLFMLGRLDEAWAESERFVNPSGDLPLLATQADIRLAVLWARGDLEGFEAIVAVCTDFAERLGFRQRWVSLLQKRGILEVLLGRPLTLPTPSVPQSIWFTDDERSLERALRLLDDGDERGATRLLEGPVTLIAGTNASTFGPLAAAARIITASERRDADDTAVEPGVESFPGAFAPALHAAHALATLRRQDRNDALPTLDPSALSPGLVRALFVPRHRAELAALAFANGQGAFAQAIVDGLGPLASHRIGLLRDHRVPAIADAAAALTGALPNRPAAPILVRLLGGVEITTNALDEIEDEGPAGDHPNLRRSRVKALLGYLATRPSVSRTTLFEDLWPDLDEPSARNNFRVTLSHLLTVLEPDRPKSATPFTIRQADAQVTLVDDPMIRIDVREIAELASAAHEAHERGDLDEAFELHRRIVTLHRGDFLPEFEFEDWAIAVRDRLRQTVAAAAQSAAELLVARTKYAEAESLAAYALTLDPYREAAHRVVVASRLLRGDRASAQRAFVELDAMLADLGVRPEPATEILRSRLRA